jgi:RNA polymerase sigma-70 factor, ECF subfamily
MDEEGIIEKTLKGDHQAFGELIQKYERDVYGLALLRVRNRADAEEIAQEVFLTAFRKLGQLNDGKRFGAWLRAITMSHCALWFRSVRKERKDKFDENNQFPEQFTAEIHLAGQDPFDIEGLIRELPPGMQAAAMLCLEKELEPTAAAGILGLKPGTLRKRFHAARAKLQRSIVQQAEEKGQLDLLPRDFAKLCICRCEKAQTAQKGGENRMNQLKNCGCGCMEKGRQEEGNKEVPRVAEAPKGEKSKPAKQ